MKATEQDYTLRVLFSPGEEDQVLAMDWSIYHNSVFDVLVICEGFRSPNHQIEGWDDAEWPYSMRLEQSDFADDRSSCFVHKFPVTVKIRSLTTPKLGQALLDELGPITDYLLTFDSDTEEYGIRVRDLTPEQSEYWVVVKLSRG